MELKTFGTFKGEGPIPCGNVSNIACPRDPFEPWNNAQVVYHLPGQVGHSDYYGRIRIVCQVPPTHSRCQYEGSRFCSEDGHSGGKARPKGPYKQGRKGHHFRP